MAKYEREFLVPYLRNACALYFTMDEIWRRRNGVWRRIEEIKKGALLEKVNYPDMSPIITRERVLMLAVGIGILAAVVLFMISPSGVGDNLVILLAGVAVAVFLIAKTIKEMLETKEENRLRFIQYDSKTRKNKQAYEKSIRERKELMPVLQKELAAHEAEYSRAYRLLLDHYDANIIPGNYRDVYAIVYLYDYFANSYEDDLAIALNTYVLEQMKSKLDVIIRNQSTVIMNQCRMLANQYRAMDKLTSYAAEMVGKLDKLQLTNEERNHYLKMIDCNTMVMAYYLDEDYTTRLREQ